MKVQINYAGSKHIPGKQLPSCICPETLKNTKKKIREKLH